MRQTLQERIRRILAVSIPIHATTIALATILHGILFQSQYDFFILLPLVIFSLGYSVNYLTGC
jgi:archaellum biogenesis protein FlaJ (TadC family)